MNDESASGRRRRAPIWGAGLSAFINPAEAQPQPAAPLQPGYPPQQPAGYPPQPSSYPAQAAPAPAAAGPALVPVARPNLPPDEALRRLMEGNRRFLTQPDLCSANLANLAAARTANQAPYAVILSCSDSRVAPEMIFGGVGPGELFIVRNAGNLADDFAIGSIELGTAYLGASVVLVMAHENCGAVKAACDMVMRNIYYPPSIEAVVQPILPAALAVRGVAGDFTTNALRESARRTAARIPERSAILSDLAQQGRLIVRPAEFSLATGAVQLI